MTFNKCNKRANFSAVEHNDITIFSRIRRNEIFMLLSTIFLLIPISEDRFNELNIWLIVRACSTKFFSLKVTCLPALAGFSLVNQKLCMINEKYEVRCYVFCLQSILVLQCIYVYILANLF